MNLYNVIYHDLTHDIERQTIYVVASSFDEAALLADENIIEHIIVTAVECLMKDVPIEGVKE